MLDGLFSPLLLSNEVKFEALKRASCFLQPRKQETRVSRATLEVLIFDPEMAESYQEPMSWTE